MKKTVMILMLGILTAISACGQPGGNRPQGGGGNPPEGFTPGGPGGRHGGPGEHPGGPGGPGGEMGGKSGAEQTYAFGTSINDQWRYDKETDTYYIVGVMYCAKAADESHEQMGIYVPAAYMNAVANSDSTYTCTINTQAQVNGYTATTAPIVIPVNTPGYSAMSAPSGFNARVSEYTSHGFIYLQAGCRGKDSGAPLGVTDLKAAVRYYRYLAAEQHAVPGDTERMFTFGHSGGGAQSAIMGASGNSELYSDYLMAIGAKMEYRDDIAGSMCWCPITNLDQADAAYEWNMGQTRSELSATEQNISKALASEFAQYINAIGLKNPTTGETLQLQATSDGYFQSGSYYSYIMEVINDAVSRYNRYNDGNVATYSTADQQALAAFAKENKKASKGLGAFDDYDGQGRTSAENQLFDPQGESAHFDKYLAQIVTQYAPDYSESFAEDLAQTDNLGKNLDTRLNMYTPLYYLIDNSTYYAGGGKGSSTVAPHWRIRTGITQGDTSLCTEANLAVALKNSGINDVDFETVWGQGHTEAEDSGNGNSNFIAWVEQCCAQ